MISNTRHQFLIDRGEEYLVEPGRDSVRSTIKGTWVAFLRSWRVPSYVTRFDPVSGAVVRLRAAKARVPAPLRYAEWPFMLLLVGTLFWESLNPIRTPRAALLRFGMTVFAAAGLVVVTILKWVARQRPVEPE
jgi:hypothetical protein